MAIMTKPGDTTVGTTDNWDQTDPQWLIDLSPDHLGTGLFLVKESDSAAIKKLHKSDIRYGQFKGYGSLKQAIAIKWVPHSISDEETLLRLQCHGSCEETCVQPGCICDATNHQCV